MGSDAISSEAVRSSADSKVIAICADDYGVDLHVDRAIVDLARIGRLTATSVLVDARISDQSRAALQALEIDIGLHLNFTEELGDLSADTVMPLGQLILRAQTRCLSRRWVRQNIERQLNRFEALLGRTPDYVDGHLHVHQLPIIGDELLAALRDRQLPAGFWVRDTRAGELSDSPWSERFKSWVVGNLGMHRLTLNAASQGIHTNRGFFGVYDFTKSHRPFIEMMRAWLAHAVPGALIMTHPSKQALPGDPIGQARVDEYQILASDAFGHLLQQQGVRLARSSQALSSLP
ncbi:ChbG/HpnK family deacetylase [Orrella daihaiensis]|uniref:ChbG/HpnK family deacetylase n=1 Tax=Orrella daihaiensis TaxID=2782176 RepID=A0ABY4ALS1_9BURK|nr:ChbG/HpnK family deacetylase [Orrella daihaiensis]UOD51223.1 ChbG/HpnK family deacetylase [Orrella daihaiensis]